MRTYAAIMNHWINSADQTDSKHRQFNWMKKYLNNVLFYLMLSSIK